MKISSFFSSEIKQEDSNLFWSDKGFLGTVGNPETDSLNYGSLEITLLFPLISSAFLVFKILLFRYVKYT